MAWVTCWSCGTEQTVPDGADSSAYACAECGKFFRSDPGAPPAAAGAAAPSRMKYHVDAFIPAGGGCMGSESGWDAKRCKEFTAFLNGYAHKGWLLHSYEYRTVSVQSGCGSQTGQWLVCVFQRAA